MSKSADMVQSTRPSQNAQNTRCWDRFWKIRCGKCARLWREAHVQVR